MLKLDFTKKEAKYIKDIDSSLYKKYKIDLYEMAYGKKISKDMADKWVKEMKPVGLYWTLEETDDVIKSSSYNVDNIDFFVVANMMYNDYYDIVKDDEELAIKMAIDWLNDEDATKSKLYCYWKYIVENK